MKSLLLLLAIHLTAICSYAQNFSNEFGRVTNDEMTMTSYPKDNGADAFIIYDIGKSYFSYDYHKGFEVIFERKMKIKILKKSGFQWAEFSIPLYQEDYQLEKLFDVNCTTYNLENNKLSKTTLDKNTIYEEKTSGNWINKKFAMPNVKEGSVIEISYYIYSPYLFNLHDWQFQHTIPTVYSEYTVKITPYYEYVYILQGTNKFDVFNKSFESNNGSHPGSDNYENVVYQFAMKDVPAFKDESYITSINDYIMQIDFQLTKIHRLDGTKKEVISTWPKLIDDLLKHQDFGKYVNGAEKNAKDLLNIAELKSKPKITQLEEIVNYVKNNYKWNGYNSYLVEKNLKNFQKDKSGNSANINLFLAGLLRAAGFKAYPVIISTRNHGKIASDYPFSHYFNYAIVMVEMDDKIYVTDATDPLCPYNIIPPKCVNDKGLIIKKDSQDWLTLTNGEFSTIEEKIVMKINEKADTINCKLSLSSTGYDAIDLKSDYNNEVEKLEKKFLENHFLQIDSLKTMNYEDPLKPYLISFNAKYPLESIDSKVYISPFLSEVLTENPFKQQNRQYPVDMIYPQRRVYNATILIPENYKIENLPQNQTINNDLFTMEYQATKINDQTIVVQSVYTSNNAVYSSKEYVKIRFFFNELIEKLNAKIVLSKN
jgi:transglutaminase-like putative cysteine protease